MGTTPNTRTLANTPGEVRDRGGELLHRLRRAGIWQYNRWFLDKEPKWKGDASIQHRITLILNGRGTLEDAVVLRKCELIVDRALDGRKSAA